MTNNIRGIECSLYNGRIEDVLLFLSQKSFEFYVKWCMKIDNNQQLLPKSTRDYPVSAHDLCELAKMSIWELVLHAYPTGANSCTIETYSDYKKSACTCCLIFYDCGLLDIYTKDLCLCNQLYELLLSLQAKDIAYITDLSDNRTHLYP